MTTSISPATAPARRSGRSLAARIGLWAVRILLAIQFVMGGMLKLVADPQMVAMFDDIGVGQGLRVFVGVCEVVGGIGVLVPRVARLAATGLVGLLVGAAVTNVVVLEISPIVPLTLLGLALLVAVALPGKRAGR